MNPKGCAIASLWGSRIPRGTQEHPWGDIEPISPKDGVALWHCYMAYFSFLFSSYTLHYGKMIHGDFDYMTECILFYFFGSHLILTQNIKTPSPQHKQPNLMARTVVPRLHAMMQEREMGNGWSGARVCTRQPPATQRLPPKQSKKIKSASMPDHHVKGQPAASTYV